MPDKQTIKEAIATSSSLCKKAWNQWCIWLDMFLS